MAYKFYPVGGPKTQEYRVYFLKDEQPISPFHDIPLWVDRDQGIANMVVEIPRGTQPKLEISTKEFLNPIKQDIKDGKLRDVAIPYTFNYGAFPQTWESPFATGLKDEKGEVTYGDNDPLDVVDISERPSVTGEVRPVKVLGVWGMIDAGETDWKILVIDVEDPRAAGLNGIKDIKEIADKPDVRQAFDFLKTYKAFDKEGKPDPSKNNKFAYSGYLQPKGKALEVIEECHQQWKQLIKWTPFKVARTISIKGSDGNELPGKAHGEEIEGLKKSIRL
eukprot:TRINITY_DN122_c0_g1_i5.p1 TRINITY_DN122_c0_g1~~TRINITY_DN122_c0_g1_i5.p1  ORF type:complete len:277 (-),score=57.96 TRINITY_DN122_c0_g1_i5:167-997(-)